MASQEHMERLRNGIDGWHRWREEHPKTRPNLSGADLSDLKLGGVDLSRANLSKANLSKGYLSEADLSGANLSGADLSGADVSKANLSKANLNRADLRRAYVSGTDLSEASLEEAQLGEAFLNGANLSEANLNRADLSEAHLVGAQLIEARLHEANLALADLSEANLNQANLSSAELGGTILSGAQLCGADLGSANLTDATLMDANLRDASLVDAILVRTILKRANLTGIAIHGMLTWKPQLTGAIQSDLVISESGEPVITVDGFDMAQFLYLLLNNPMMASVLKIRASKIVCILGRFLPDKKNILNALRDELRIRQYVPITMLIDKSIGRDLAGIVTMLARMACFVIADVSDSPHLARELQKSVLPLQVPVQVIAQAKSKHPEALSGWQLDPFRYTNIDHAMASLREQIIEPVERKARELQR